MVPAIGDQSQAPCPGTKIIHTTTFNPFGEINIPRSVLQYLPIASLAASLLFIAAGPATAHEKPTTHRTSAQAIEHVMKAQFDTWPKSLRSGKTRFTPFKPSKANAKKSGLILS